MYRDRSVLVHTRERSSWRMNAKSDVLCLFPTLAEHFSAGLTDWLPFFFLKLTSRISVILIKKCSTIFVNLSSFYYLTEHHLRVTAKEVFEMKSNLLPWTCPIIQTRTHWSKQDKNIEISGDWQFTESKQSPPYLCHMFLFMNSNVY